MNHDPAGEAPVEQELGLAAGARWYCLSRDGLATLCHDEEDAHEVAAESWVLYPQNGPYRVAQMVDASAVAEAVAAERERWRLKLTAHRDRTVMSCYASLRECEAARNALQRVLDDGPNVRGNRETTA